MAPIRRYLCISKKVVLEVRIYLDKPSDSPWLLSSREPVLPRIMETIRPKVLPKLREESANAKKKSGKKYKGIKDVVSTEDFEVVIFLKDLSTRHSLLAKQKHFVYDPQAKSTSTKLTGWLNNREDPIDLDAQQKEIAVLQEEESDNEDDVVELYNIPEAGRGSKRSASRAKDNPMFVSSDEEQVETGSRARKRQRSAGQSNDTDLERDDKKKMALNTFYNGFSIYGRTLCLVVKRKGKSVAADIATAPQGSSQMMEQWIGTQAAQEAGLDEYDEG